MRKSTPLFLVFAFTLTALAQETTASTQMAGSLSTAMIALKDGTAVHLRLDQAVSSAEAHTGDPVVLETTEDVVVNGRVIVPKGAKASATALMPDSKKVKGQVDINIGQLTLADGTEVALRAKEAAVSATRTLEFFPPAPPYPYMSGKDKILPKDLLVTAFVSGDLALRTAAFQLATPSPATVAQVANPPATELDVTSTPSGAGIEVDGLVVGETPSAVAVRAGDHTVSVRMAGFDPWHQLIHAGGGKIALNVQLKNGGANGETMSCWGGMDCVTSNTGIAPVVTTKPVMQQKKKPTTNSSDE